MISNTQKQSQKADKFDLANLSKCVKPVPIDNAKEEIIQRLNIDRLTAFQVPLTTQEMKKLQSLQIAVDGVNGNFLYWGDISTANFSENLTQYLNSIVKNDTETIHILHRVFFNLAKHATGYFDTNFAWVEIKTFFPSDTFVIPRWHTDNKFFAPHTAYKLVWAAKGPQTRFGVASDIDEFERLTALEIGAGHGTAKNLQVRRELDDIVSEFHMSQQGNAVLYRSGGNDPMVHSEPNITESRIFVAIVPGTQEEIRLWHARKELKDTRKQVASRPWSFFNLMES